MAPPADANPLVTPLEKLPGVGTARARRLAPLGLQVVKDALLLLPRDYRAFSGAHAFADVCEGEHASVSGHVVDVAQRTSFGGRSVLTVLVQVEGGSLRAIWFNMPFMAKRFAAGMPQDVGPAARAGVAAARAVGEEDDLGLADGCGASRRVHACRFRYGSGILGGSGGRQERLGSLGGRRSRVRG